MPDEIQTTNLSRLDAAVFLAHASGHTVDDCILIVAALENDRVRLVRDRQNAVVEAEEEWLDELEAEARHGQS